MCSHTHIQIGVTRWKRCQYWVLSQLLRLVEVSVKCLEVIVEGTVTSNTILIWMFRVTGHIEVMAKPLPNR